MTYFISSDYQKPNNIPPEQELEISSSPTESLQDILQKTTGISDAFKDDLLSLDQTIMYTHTSHGGALGLDQWPNDVTRRHILIQAEQVWKCSGKCTLAFLDAARVALPVLSRGEFNDWVNIGRDILKTDEEAVELCLAYFQTSPYLIKKGAYNFISGWVEQNRLIASFSSKTSLAFYRATPEFISVDRPFHLRKWAEKVIQILETGKGREAVAIAFIETSPRIVQKITFKELMSWCSIGVKIATDAPGLAVTYFSETSEGINSLYNIEILKFLDLTSLLVDVGLDRAIDFYHRCPDELASLNPNVRVRVLDASKNLAAECPEDIIGIFNDILSALRPVFFPIQEKVMKSGLAISQLSLKASRIYFKSVRSVLREIPEVFLSNWIEKGLARLSESEQFGIDYFSLNSEESRSELIKWKEAVLLEDHKQALSIFAHALSGRELKLKKRRGPDSKKGSSLRRYPMDGKTVFLPAFFADEPDRPGNFRLYKVKIAHQAGYIEFGTFAPVFWKIASLLEAFPLHLLARDIFFIIEDSRIDFLLRREYRGLTSEIDQTVASCIGRRIFPDQDPLGEALEILLRLTMDCLDEKRISLEMQDWANGLKKAMDGFYENAHGAWDSFQKAAELYESFSGLIVKDLYLPISPLPFHDRPNLDYFIGSKKVMDAPEGLNNDEAGSDEAIHAMSEEDIKRLLEKIKDPKFLQNLEKDTGGEGFCISNIEGLIPMDAKDGPGEEGAPGKRSPAVSPARSNRRQGPFYYDEWDYKQRAYRRKWCTLWEQSVPKNELGLFDKIYDNYSELIQKVKKQFQRIRPEVLEIVRRVEWGPEIDFNAMIQSVVDRKAGDSPSGKIFTRKDKKVRRISTVLLVDMSASTDRLVSLVNPGGQTLCQSGDKGPHEKKIIDVEIEGLVVITEALQSLGDDYAIFGFSGYGRDQVDFYSIKEFTDPYSERVKSRICGIQPQKGTRMGPAIRHAVEKLNQVESDHRLLVLLSDGFPQDLDYGEDRSSKDYALHDTMMALAEAKKFGIRPFCITVDLAGDDYLRKMWDPGSYLIVKDVYSLPEVLPKVVESLVL